MQGPGTSPLSADWYLVAFPYLLVLTKILRFVETLQRVSTKPKLALNLPIKGPSDCRLTDPG